MNSSKNIVNNDDKNFQCEICEKLYTTKHCLKNHIDKCHHENNMPKKLYKCHICNKELHSNPYLDTHIKIVHEGKKPHKCKMCNKSFTDAGTVKKHIYTIHERNKNYKCDSCGNHFLMLITCKHISNQYMKVVKTSNVFHVGIFY